jgi:hypothetical protein
MAVREDKLAVKRIILRHWLASLKVEEDFKRDFFNSLLTYTWCFREEIHSIVILFTVLKFIDSCSNIFEITENLNDIIRRAANNTLESKKTANSVLFLSLENDTLTSLIIDNGLFENRMLKKLPIVLTNSSVALRKGAFLIENNQYGGIIKLQISYVHFYMITI